MNKFKILSIFGAMILLVRCSIPIQRVEVDLYPNFVEYSKKENALSMIQSTIAFSMGDFVDKRLDTTNLATYRRELNTYCVYAKRPVDATIFKGIKSLITLSGHEWVDKGPAEIQVNLRLLNAHADRTSTLGRYSSGIQIRLDFVNTSTDEIIYSGTYKGIYNKGWTIVESIETSIINCVNSIGMDKELAKILKKFKLKHT